ncbi:hypothetical protein K7711_22525 [Nocardia sp. CA2R105]|uniref:hypothetical protein n=1 Tax=Nocardia coffeae TaxID=2873381 RepID=UPI001CA740FA|nr:hypothetical protein [Nocardia coffeae]MBY8859268.1 hypothetical protein [Nocardia coffeae]
MNTPQADSLPGRREKRGLRSRLAWRLFLACTVACCAGLLIHSSDPAGAESVLWTLFSIVAAVVFFYGMVGYLSRVVVSRRLRVPELGPLLAPALVVACTAAAWSVDLPIIVRWQFSERAFGDAARQVRNGVDPRTFEGHRLGLYRVDDTDHPTSSIYRDATGIYFATGPAAGQCANRSGFAQVTGDHPADGALHHLGGDWYWFCFDSSGEKTIVPDHPIGG